MRLFQSAQIWFGLLEFTEMFMIHANLNGPLLICPDVSNCTQVWMELFQLPKLDWGCLGIYPNVSNCTIKHLYIPRFQWSCLKLPQLEWSCSTWPKFERSCCHLLKVGLVCWNLPKIFQVMEIFLISPKFEWSCFNLLKVDWGC